MTGSTTKAFTAAAAALLVHDTKAYATFKWSSPINQFLPEDFVLENDYATTHVTVEDAVVHRAGLPRHDLVHGQPNDKPADVTRRLRYLPLTSEPGRSHQYCPLMYGVLTHLLETVIGESLGNFLEKEFWKQLGMLSTTFALPKDDSNLARGYYWHEDGESYIAEPYDDVSSISGSGAIFSTVNDYALWIKALLEANDDSHPENRSSPLTNKLVHDLFTPRIITDDFQSDYNPQLYALGWDVLNVVGETIIAHDGGETGFGTGVFMVPSRQYGIATMANTEVSGAIAGSLLAQRLLLEKLNSSKTVHPEDLIPRRRKRAVRTPGHTTQNLYKTSQNRALRTISLAEYTGTYSHPAYGAFNLTLSKDEEILEALFYPRTWPIKIQFIHTNTKNFNLRFLYPHGIGNIWTEEGIVWESDDDNGDEGYRAAFEYGRDGTSAERLGMELEENLVEMARDLSENEWRRGMIWFDKV